MTHSSRKEQRECVKGGVGEIEQETAVPSEAGNRDIDKVCESTRAAKPVDEVEQETAVPPEAGNRDIDKVCESTRAATNNESM